MRLPFFGGLALGIPELILLVVVVGLLGGVIVLVVMFLRTLRTALRLTREQHGRPPDLVWLLLVPVLSFLLGFYVVSILSNSIRAQLARRGIEHRSAGWIAGMLWNAAGAVEFVVRGKPQTAAGLVSGFALIVYWVQISRLNRLLQDSLSSPSAH